MKAILRLTPIMFNNKKIETLESQIAHVTDVVAAHMDATEFNGPKHPQDSAILVSFVDQLRKDCETHFAMVRKEIADLTELVSSFKKYASETGALASQTRTTVEAHSNNILNASKRLNLLAEKQGLEFFADPVTAQLDIRKKVKIKPLDMSKVIPAGDPIANLFKDPNKQLVWEVAQNQAQQTPAAPQATQPAKLPKKVKAKVKGPKNPNGKLHR